MFMERPAGCSWNSWPDAVECAARNPAGHRFDHGDLEEGSNRLGGAVDVFAPNPENWTTRFWNARLRLYGVNGGGKTSHGAAQ